MTKIVESIEPAFNVENILTGVFASSKGGKTSNFKMYSSLRLLTESGQQFSSEMMDFLTKVTLKWNYWKKLTDTNNGSIIVSLHTKKAPTSWLYVVVKQDGTYTEYSTIMDAKNNLINE